MRFGLFGQSSLPSRRTTSGLRTRVALGLVVFYLLASGRALIPGLCATQAANLAGCGAPVGQETISDPAAHCCSVPAEAPADGSGDRRPVTPAESQCAFCNLLIAHTDPPLGVYLPAPAPARHAAEILLHAQRAQTVDFGAAPNRAPPA